MPFPLHGPQQNSLLVVTLILKIQKDEALDSYISRNRLVLRDKLGLKDPFESLQGNEWSIKDLIVIADLTKLKFFNGFINLIQMHTIYFRCHFVIDNIESMLLRHKYLELSKDDFGYVTRREDIAICIECVKGDISQLGYSYWRRSHQDEIKVCAIHNVELITKCQFCDNAFRAINHTSFVLWNGCKCGRHVLEAKARINECKLELKKSILYSDLLSFDRKIECVAIYESFLSALRSDGRSQDLWGEVIDERYESSLHLKAKFDFSYEEVKLLLKVGPENLRNCYPVVIALIFLLFTDFDEFVACIKIATQKKSLQFESVTEKRVIFS